MTGGSEAVAGDGGTAGGTSPCDTTKSPRLEHCVVERGAAIFVSPNGDDGNAGGMDAPVMTIQRALSLARSADKAVIVCAGTYKENLSITGKSSAKIYGGFDCEAGWMLADERTVIAPDTGVPLTITDAGGEVVLEGIELRAASATSPGASSIAVIVSSSANVTLRDSRLVAGDGADGKDAEEDAGFSFDPPEALNGNSAMNERGGEALTCECPAGDETVGGKGGKGDPDDDGPELPGGGDKGMPDRGAGAGGLATETCDKGGIGRTGNPAPPQTKFGKGASTYGTWTNNTWTPTDGESGPHGAAGQGGGGGRGGKSGGGGGGGCGGCGGKGGDGGGGGGASLALVSIASTVVLRDSALVLGKAGKGGSGAEGQEGQDGGFAGDGGMSACDGGAGGKGSSGAPGGGGAGGISVGVLFQGEEPTLTRVEYRAGSLGEGGGLGGSTMSTMDDGTRGIAEKVFKLP
jgi:hypothetical protein